HQYRVADGVYSVGADRLAGGPEHGRGAGHWCPPGCGDSAEARRGVYPVDDRGCLRGDQHQPVVERLTPFMVVSSLAGCQPYRADWLPLRGSLCGAPPPRPNVRRRISLPTSLARVPALSSFTKANKAYAAKGHPCPYPLVWNHPNDAIGFGKLRAGTNGPKKQWRLRRHGFIERATRAKPKTKNQKPKTKNQKPKTKNQKPKTKNQKPKTKKQKTKNKKQKKKLFRPQAAKTYSGCCGFSRPIRASPQIKKYGSHARMIPGKDRGTGRALRSVGLTGFF